jgi:hypothetical protein
LGFGGYVGLILAICAQTKLSPREKRNRSFAFSDFLPNKKGMLDESFLSFVFRVCFVVTKIPLKNEGLGVPKKHA